MCIQTDSTGNITIEDDYSRGAEKYFERLLDRYDDMNLLVLINSLTKKIQLEVQLANVIQKISVDACSNLGYRSFMLALQTFNKG